MIITEDLFNQVIKKTPSRLVLDFFGMDKPHKGWKQDILGKQVDDAKFALLIQQEEARIAKVKEAERRCNERWQKQMAEESELNEKMYRLWLYETEIFLRNLFKGTPSSEEVREAIGKIAAEGDNF